MRTSIDFPDKLLREAKIAAVNRGVTLRELVTDALDQLLARMPELDAMAEKAKRKG